MFNVIICYVNIRCSIYFCSNVLSELKLMSPLIVALSLFYGGICRQSLNRIETRKQNCWRLRESQKVVETFDLWNSQSGNYFNRAKPIVVSKLFGRTKAGKKYRERVSQYNHYNHASKHKKSSITSSYPRSTTAAKKKQELLEFTDTEGEPHVESNLINFCRLNCISILYCLRRFDSHNHYMHYDDRDKVQTWRAHVKYLRCNFDWALLLPNAHKIYQVDKWDHQTKTAQHSLPLISGPSW